MAYSELDKRLLKRAVQVEARRVLTKRAAGEFVSMFGPDMTNEQFGGHIMSHLQNIIQYAPGTPEFNRYIAENNITPDQGQFLYNISSDLVRLAGDPETAAAMGGGFNSSNFAKILETPKGQAIKDKLMSGFVPEGIMDQASALVGPGRRALTQTPAYQTLSDQAAKDQAEMSWYNPVGLMPTGAVAGYRAISDPNQLKQMLTQAGGQFLTGVGQKFDPNSALARRSIAQGATGYLENKINQWAPTDSMFGRGANSLGKFLLGLVSMMPGYESIVNWLANRDFMFGKELKALPGQIQAQGARMLPGGAAPQQVAVAPAAQPAAPPAVRQPAPPAVRQPAPPAPPPAPTPPAQQRVVADHNTQNKPRQ